MTLWRQTRNIHLAIPEEILADIDELAKSHFMSRSEYIRQVLHTEIIAKQQQINDFRKISKQEKPYFYDLDDS